MDSWLTLTGFWRRAVNSDLAFRRYFSCQAYSTWHCRTASPEVSMTLRQFTFIVLIWSTLSGKPLSTTFLSRCIIFIFLKIRSILSMLNRNLLCHSWQSRFIHDVILTQPFKKVQIITHLTDVTLFCLVFVLSRLMVMNCCYWSSICHEYMSNNSARHAGKSGGRDLQNS